MTKIELPEIELWKTIKNKCLKRYFEVFPNEVHIYFVKYHTGFSAFPIDNIAKVHLVSHVYDIKFCIW
jgi:hypothetical protein